jgi:hypothetical protein
LSDLKENIIKEESYKFALRIVKLYKYLCEEKKEFVISKQLLRAGTSYKEARETKYWIKLLEDSGYINSKEANSILNDCEDILRITGKIISTSKLNRLTKNTWLY